MRVAWHTLGCRLNRCDSEAMAGRLRRAGFEDARGENEPQAVVVNTCTVTAASDNQCRQLIRRCAREHPDAPIVVIGCYAERAPDQLAALPGVRLVLGKGESENLPGRLAALLEMPPPAAASAGAAPVAPVSGRRSRPLVKVQDGCDNRCAYCVVSGLRGRPRSAAAGQVAGRVRVLHLAGNREVVLTGLHLGAWGRDLEPPGTLADLLARLLEEEGPRLRLSSIEPNELDERLLGLISSSGRICRHLHLPLQSGSDRVLERMGRGYGVDEYRGALERAAARVTGAALGADVIAGFPGEDDEDFAATCRLVEELPLTYLHVFPFSRRPGTPAERMPGQVPPALGRERARRLGAIGRVKTDRFRARFLGQTLPCVVERSPDRATGLWRGVSDNYLKVLVEGSDSLAGELVPLRIERLEGGLLHGRVVD